MRSIRVSVAVLLLVSAVGVAAAAGDVLSKFKMSREDAAQAVLEAFQHGNVPYWGAREAMKALGADARAALVEQAMMWAKAYVNSAEFKAAYAREREAAKPEAPEEKGSADEQLKAQNDELNQQIAEMRKNAATLPADQKKMIEEAIRQLQQMQKENAANPEVAKMQKQGIEMQKQEQLEEHKKDIAEWQKNYPADSKQLVARRLREFLAATADVDFSAKLVSSGGKQRFANAAYESKPAEWKLAYRAGKPSVDKARAFAQAWLAEIR